MEITRQHAVVTGNDPHLVARRRMVGEIRLMADEACDYAIPEDVFHVMSKLPRHRFVPVDEYDAAYCNYPLPIGYGQTISQPYIVALMTGLLALNKRASVLEVGTGSGYQTAVLAEMAGKVYSVEIVGELVVQAEKRLKELGYANVRMKCSDGNEGWPEHAPFDGIIVTAAAQHVPQALLDQLKNGGRMVIPVGDLWQELILITRDSNGTIDQRVILPVRFVPLIGTQ
jgi:protein-L-isoaspartate(D-aspartate) O-methyltransferase